MTGQKLRAVRRSVADASAEMESSEWVRALITGDEHAFDQIFRRFATPLTRYASRIVSSDAVAQDIVMDVFMRLWRDRLALPSDTHLGAYLRVSVRNSCMNYLRHHRIEASIEEIGAAGGWAPAMSVAPLMPDADLERSEAKEFVRHALAALSPRMRLVLEMRWLGEKSYKEIANELGLQVRSVETSVARAMRILRDRMKGNGGTK
jgi:RNA polymerase sigma-70 factor (ECF subfamily)